MGLLDSSAAQNATTRMNKKYQVFISSTFSDLVQERQDAIRSVLDLGHIPSGMEAFQAADIEQFKYIKKVVDECDYYVLVIGARYGSTDAAGVSFTEKEYDYAVEQKKTVLAFIHGNPSAIAVAKADIDPALAAKLEAFRKKVSTGRLVQFWTSRENLESKVIKALAKAFNDAPGVGWIRGDCCFGRYARPNQWTSKSERCTSIRKWATATPKSTKSRRNCRAK
jgi:hypothetical protein